MLKTTRWSPDTCDCVLEYEWDTDAPQESRTHSFKNAVKKCQFHQEIADNANAYSHVLKENQTKNKTLGIIMEKLPKLVSIEQDDQGQEIKKLKKGVEFKWSFSGTGENRKLQCEIVGDSLNTQEKQLLKTETDKLEKQVEIA